MQTISVRTTQNVVIQHHIASIGDRILATIIDGLVMMAYAALLVLSMYSSNFPFWVYLIFLLAPLVLYHLLFEIFMNGQSPGKKAMNIQVVKMDGTEPGFGEYFLRWIFGLIERGAIAVLVVAVNGRGQRLGDIVASTTVVKIVPETAISAERVFIQPENTHQVMFPQAADLQAHDIEIIQRAIEAYRDFGNLDPVIKVSEKIKSHLRIDTDLDPLSFVYRLIKDYNHLNSL